MPPSKRLDVEASLDRAVSLRPSPDTSQPPGCVSMLELTSFPSGASQAPQALDQRLGMPPRQARRYPDDKHSYGPIANTKKSYAKRAACQVESIELEALRECQSKRRGQHFQGRGRFPEKAKGSVSERSPESAQNVMRGKSGARNGESLSRRDSQPSIAYVRRGRSFLRRARRTAFAVTGCDPFGSL